MEENNKTIHSGFWSNMFKAPAEEPEEITLQNLAPFRYLDKKEIELLINFLHNRNYIAGEYIFCQGDPGIGLYIIQEGKVEIKATDEFQREITLAFLSKGDFFGELALIDGEKRSASALAKTDVKLSVMFKPDLDEFIEKNPKKGNKILQGLSQTIALRLRTVNEELVRFLSKQSIQENLFKD